MSVDRNVLLRPLALVAVALAVVVALPGCGQDTETLSWQLQAVHPHALDVEAIYGGCFGDPRARTRETATTVVIDITATNQDPGDSCTAQGVGKTMRILLRRPLGTRSLLGCHSRGAPCNRIT